MNNKKILFVDDETIILKSFCVALKHLGYIPRAASSGEQAMTMLQSEFYDVVVTDLRMPGIDGIQVLKEAKRKYPEVIVIVLTGYGDINTAIDSLRLGADDYLHKPCDIEELVFRIEKYLDKKQTEKKLRIEQQRATRFEMISTLAAGLAHDFNNLLTGIMGSIELAELAEAQEQPTQSFLSMAMDSCSEAQELTYKFNQLSDMFIPVPSTFSVQDLLSSASKKISPDTSNIINNVLPEDLWHIKVDPEKISMAVQAILINAVEALSPGATIRISAENFDTSESAQNAPVQLPQGKFVKITIMDSGIGIPPENLTKVLNPYFSTKGKGATKGMGLGLTLASAFVEQNMGHLHVASTTGQGTTVSLYLPGYPTH